MTKIIEFSERADFVTRRAQPPKDLSGQPFRTPDGERLYTAAEVREATESMARAVVSYVEPTLLSMAHNGVVKVADIQRYFSILKSSTP